MSARIPHDLKPPASWTVAAVPSAVLLVFTLLLAGPVPVHAQSPAERVVADWLRDQQNASNAVERVTLRAEMELFLTSGQTTRRIHSRTLLSFAPGDRPDRTLEWLEVDSTRMQPESSDRYDARLRSLLGDGPEGNILIGDQAAGTLLPVPLVRSLQLVPRVVERQRDGVAYMVVTGRPDMRPEARPGPPPGRFQGQRRPPRPISAAPPRHVVTLWFTRDSRQLSYVEHRIAMPRGQGLIVNTRLARLKDLDIPVSRKVEGEIPSSRRLRTVTLHVNQQINFLDHELTRTE